MKTATNWKSKDALLKVVKLCSSNGATMSDLMKSLNIPKGSTGLFAQYLVDSFGVHLSITNDGPYKSKVYHLSEDARDYIFSIDTKSSVSKKKYSTTDDRTSDRKLTPITDEKKKEVDLMIVDAIYNNKGHRMNVPSISKKLGNKISSNYINKQVIELISNYKSCIDRDAVNPDEVIIKDYRGLIRVIKPELEFIKLVVSSSHGTEVSTKAFPGLSDSVVKKSTELLGQDIYEIHAPNTMNLSKVLMSMRRMGIRILSPCGLEEKVDKSIDEAISNYYKLIR